MKNAFHDKVITIELGDNLSDISDQHPERVALLTKAIDEWLNKTGPVRPAGYYKGQ